MQEIVDCIPEKILLGGADAMAAFEWAYHLGLTNETVNPFRKKFTIRQCELHEPVYKLKQFCFGNVGREAKNYEVGFKRLLYHFSPLVVLLNGDKLKNVRGKVNKRIDGVRNHGVLLVGWHGSYWILKNTWGKEWGKDGYLYLNKNSVPNLHEQVYYIPVL